jgi:hypothetical protein
MRAAKIDPVPSRLPVSANRYRVEMELRIPEVLVASVLSAFDDVFGQVASTPLASVALKAMPAIQPSRDDDGGLLCLSWVDIFAENAWHATSQCGQVLEEMLRLLHIPPPETLTVRASEESESGRLPEG